MKEKKILTDSQVGDKLSDLLFSVDEKRAKIAWETLVRLLPVFGGSEVQPLIDSLRKDAKEHQELLAKHPLMYKQIMDFSTLAFSLRDETVDRKDIIVTHDFSSLLHLLALSYEEHGASREIKEILADVYPKVFSDFLNASSNQITTLCQFLRRIRNFISKLSLSKSRIILVELPIGNSLPVSILENQISSYSEVVRIRASLSRNDKKKNGITRGEILSEKIKMLNPDKSDLILYVDEWNTGANFYTICKLLAKISRETGSFFFPCAMLTEHASSEKRYNKFCRHHDRYLQRMGVVDSGFRQVFPAINSPLQQNLTFFWAEDDRIGGWRKMQVAGSMVSSCDSALKTLKNDSDALNEALSLFIAENAKSMPSGSLPEDLFQQVRSDFFQSCNAYELLRPKIDKCADVLDEGDEVKDYDDAFKRLVEVFQDAGIGEGKEKIAMLVALTYLLRMGSFDPADRYYYENHAPIIAPLKGVMRRPHELTCDEIERCLKGFTKE